MKNLPQEQYENEDGMKICDLGSMRITVPSIVPFIWIAHVFSGTNTLTYFCQSNIYKGEKIDQVEPT
jgi:hypothetical protein